MHYLNNAFVRQDHVRFEGAGKLYQMAVRPDLQGTGIGRQLVAHLLAYARDVLKLARVYCHARHYAAGSDGWRGILSNFHSFYEKCGFRKTPGIDPFVEVGMQHFCMDIVFGGSEMQPTAITTLKTLN